MIDIVRCPKLLLAALALLVSGMLATAAVASEQANCLSCHTASNDAPVHAIFKTVHGSGGVESCVACHGDSEAHSASPVRQSPDVSFGPRWTSDPEVRDESCRGCHKGGDQIHWQNSVHQEEELSCNSCHQSHTQYDQAMSDQDQANACYACHPRQRSESRLPSRHPIAEGKTSCSDCHNPHGSPAEFSLHEPTLNDTCYSCHAEKRGPYLFEHAPAAEDCSSCHNSHGSVNDALLTSRSPFLCQQCHSAAFHPSQLTGGGGLPSGTADQNLLGKNCMNCHSAVHGSNHPSGARLTR